MVEFLDGAELAYQFIKSIRGTNPLAFHNQWFNREKFCQRTNDQVVRRPIKPLCQPQWIQTLDAHLIQPQLAEQEGVDIRFLGDNFVQGGA